MHLLRKPGSFSMADLDMPKTWEGAARWFLGGTLVFASGFEAVVLFWEGKFLPALGSLFVALVLIGFLLSWDSLREKIPRLTGAITSASKDGRLWAVLLLVIAEFSRFPGTVWHESWLYGLPLAVAVVMFFASWKYLKPPEGQQPSASGLTISAGTPPERPASNPQVDRDLLLLLDFNVLQATAALLDDLIRQVPPEIDEKSVVNLSNDSITRYHDAQEYVRKVGSKLDPQSHRGAVFRSLMQSAEYEAERHIELTPPSERPPRD
jgi:hypothetical protein